MKHTPGTWIYKDGQIYAEKTGYTISVTPYFDKEDQEQVANAKLIAAAPTILEECQNVMDNLIQESSEVWKHEITRLEYAINQAIGE